MSITIRNSGLGSYQLFYASGGFVEGLTVTGYIIYPDLTKSSVLPFDELGDGIYVGIVPYVRKTMEYDEKYGMVIKENGETKYFGLIQMIN